MGAARGMYANAVGKGIVAGFFLTTVMLFYHVCDACVFQ